MSKNYYLSVLGLLLSFMLMLSACQSAQPTDKTYEHPLCKFSLLSKTAGEQAVVTDTQEGYFDKVTALEITLLLHLEKAASSRDEVMDAYKQKLQVDVLDFTPEEQKDLSELFTTALDMCAKINPQLNLPEIKLIKTAGGYYGASVFYTRDNCIIIPAAQLKAKMLLRTLIHEIFHIYSRYNRDKRDALYATIGYNKVQNLQLSPFLEKRILYNPDGVDIAYAIEVQDTAGRSIKAIPVIYSKFSAYQMVPFHRHFVFQLFEVAADGAGWKVVQDGVGLGEDEVSDYWEKIGRNTKYTIHPDEVLADNFTILAYSKTDDNEAFSRLSPEGKALLQQIEAILKK